MKINKHSLFISIMYLAGAATLEEISIALMDKFIYDTLNAYTNFKWKRQVKHFDH